MLDGWMNTKFRFPLHAAVFCFSSKDFYLVLDKIIDPMILGSIFEGFLDLYQDGKYSGAQVFGIYRSGFWDGWYVQVTHRLLPMVKEGEELSEIKIDLQPNDVKMLLDRAIFGNLFHQTIGE